jgi:hypothetical protein
MFDLDKELGSEADLTTVSFVKNFKLFLQCHSFMTP